MRIEEFHIDGFGRFHKLSVTDLGPGLSIVLGNNEAGKSTLLAFLRTVLFGLPSRKQAEFYPPLNGGRHGGRIVLVDGQAERIVVERFAGKGSGNFTATFSDGSQLGEEQFRQRLGMVTGDVYEKVFAFGLGELQTFDTLKGDKIRDAIYNASMGTGGQSPAQVVKKLHDRCERLFKPGGSNPMMNQVLKRLVQRRRQIDEHSTDQDEYRRIQDELNRADRDSVKIGTELHRCRQRLARLHALQQSRDDWILLNDFRDQLQTLPQIESFPQDGVSRMDTLLNEQRTLRNQLQEVRDDEREAEEELSTIRVDETLLAVGSEIRGLERRVDLFEQNRRQLTAVETERKLAEQACDQNLRDLGDEWSEEKLRSFDLSIPAREELDAARQLCAEAQKRVENQAAEVELIHKQFQEKEEIEKTARADLEKLAGPAAVLDIEGIHRLQRLQASYEGACHDLPRVEQECRGNEERLSETLRSIGPDWDEEQLNRFDNSLAAREKISAHRETLDHLRSQRSQLNVRVEEENRSIEDHLSAVKRDEETLASMPESDEADETSLMEQKGRLRGLRSLLAQHTQLERELAHQEERQQDLEGQLSRWQHDVGATAAGVPRWVAPAIALLGVLGLLAMGIIREEWVSGTVVLVIFLVLAALLLVVQRKTGSVTQSDQYQRSQEKQTVVQRLAEVESRIRSFRKNESGLKTQIQQQSELAGFDGPVNVLRVDEREESAEQQLSLLQRRRPIEQRLTDNQAKLDHAKTALQDSECARGDLDEGLKRAQAAWRSWLIEARLPETFSPELTIDVLSRLDSVRELLKAIGDQRGRIRAMREEIDPYEELVRSVGMNSGIDDLPQETLAAVRFLADRLDEHEERIHRINEADRRIDEAAQRTATAQELLEEAQRKHAAKLDRQKSADRQWVELLGRRGLRETLTVQHAEQMIQGIERGRGHLTQFDKHKAKENAISEQIASFVNDAGSVAQEAGRMPPTDDDVSTCVETLAVLLQQTDEAHRRTEVLRETVQKSADRINRLDAQIAERQQEIDHLLDAAETSEEEAFRQRANDYGKFRSFTDEVHSLETRLRQLAGSGDALAALEGELEQSTPEALQTEQRELEEHVRQFEDDLGQAKELRGKLKLQLQQLENSDEISSLRIEQQADLAEFRYDAREWSILGIAAHLIDRAREKYERERRPAVLKEAERYFARLTHDNYCEILAPAGAEPSVVAPDGARKELSQLSRGTAEQLYLSLRFGFVEEFVERSEPLPLIFDDILVNFDPGRAASAAEAIVELSRSQQILLFTCHPSTVHLLKGIERDASTYELLDGRLMDGTLLQNH